MTTVAAIALRARQKTAAAITDVWKAASITRITDPGTYDPDTGEYSDPTTATDTGYAIFDTSRPVENVFPGYVATEGEKLVFFQGLSQAPAVNEVFAIGGVNHTLTKVGDIAGAGSFFAAMVVQS